MPCQGKEEKEKEVNSDIHNIVFKIKADNVISNKDLPSSDIQNKQ